MGNLLGGKSGNLGGMIGIGLPVLPGFTIITTAFYRNGCSYPADIAAHFAAALELAEQVVDLTSPRRP
jgi:pyruvate,orthophosphate dikinase